MTVGLELRVSSSAANAITSAARLAVAVCSCAIRGRDPRQPLVAVDSFDASSCDSLAPASWATEMPAPTERERSQLLAQRYLPRFPAAGEIVLFDRSWYNRAGVERVMGFCTQQQYESFLKTTPLFEREIIEDGIILIKYFFDVSRKVQEERFLARAEDEHSHRHRVGALVPSRGRRQAIGASQLYRTPAEHDPVQAGAVRAATAPQTSKAPRRDS